MYRRLRTLGITLLVMGGVALPLASTESTTASDTIAMVAVPSVAAISARAQIQPLQPEDLLLQALNTFRAGNVDGALGIVESLLDDQPKYRLAHLVKGDILASRAGLPLSIDQGSRDSESIGNLLAEARQRWHGRSFAPGDRLPAPLLKPGLEHRTIVFVDLALSRLFLFEHRGESVELIADYYVSSGKNGVGKRRKGDKKTPLGVYFVTQRLPGETLPDRYGPVAFPVDYPNEWDSRQGRTGSGIWLHGVASDTYSRPPLDSDGCVALTNSELSHIAPQIAPGSTPVLIGFNEPWLAPDEAQTRTAAIEDELEAWRQAWESGDTTNYLQYYATDFEGRGMSKRAWSDYKRRVAAGKQFVNVGISDVSVFGYPEEQDMVVVTFRQRYRSNNFNSTSRKRQYWRLQDDGRWRIISEGPATAG